MSTIQVGDIVYVGKGKQHWKVWVIEGEYARVATFTGHANRRVLLSTLTPVYSA